jgi:MOSC domain-containing protein YiiM
MYIGKDKYKDEGRHYIVSREGRFCRVVRGGSVKIGDEAQVI